VIKPEVLDAMVAAGCSAEQIAAAVKADQARSSGAERQARYRARKASRVTSHNVTGVTVTGTVPPKEKSPAPPKEITPSSSSDKSLSPCATDLFEDFWLVYPRREGSNPKKPASDRFLRLVAKGHDPHKLIDAARDFAKEHPSPTRFVPQAVTWLNQERFEGDQLSLPAADVFCAEGQEDTRLHVLRYRNEHNGNDPPSGIQAGRRGYMIPASWVRSMELRRQANG
jgi:hypothetical protein